ncbi:hypothetical protein GCM10027174_44580 [Salinifilum aidingensis]
MLLRDWHGTRPRVWAELDQLLSHPDFHHHDGSAGLTYRRLQHLARQVGPAREVYHQPERLLAAMEWAGTVDPALMHAAMVHYGVCATALVEGGDEHSTTLDALAHALDTADAVGTVLATEAGRGGSQMAMRTEAHYDPTSDTFRLHTPEDDAVKVMPNVAHTGVVHVAVVNARLIAGGVDHGVHAFAFRFPHPQAQVRAVPGGAPVPLDYAAIRFHHAAIPRDYWLAGGARIDENGAVADPLDAHQRLGRSLSGVGTALVSASVALTAAARATVATTTRFLPRRRLGGADRPVGEFSTHRCELATVVSRVAVLHGFLNRVRDDFTAERSGRSSHGDGAAVGYAPWVAANRDRTLVKVAASEALETVAGACRRLCGVHGVLHVNRVAVFEDMARSFHAAGGDNRLLLLEAGKQLAADQRAPALPAVNGGDWGEPHVVLRMLGRKERALREHVAEQAPADAGDPFAWNSLLGELETLARTHLHRRIHEETTTADPAAYTALRLHGVNLLLDDAAWHLNHGTMRPGDLDALHTTRDDATTELHHHLPALLDAMAAPPGRVGGWIGRGDYIRHITSLFPQ